MQNQVRYDPTEGATFQWLIESLMGAVEVCVNEYDCMTEVERAVGLQITALRDTQEAIAMLSKRKLTKREKAAKPLLLAYLHKIRDNTLSRTWEKGLATGSRVTDKMDLLARDTTRFMQALNLVTHPNTPLRAITITVRKYRNDVKDLH
tara:strand:+ start:1444 stop:1890 length:447 start_codon:yes stop_codon:yes gene_type:complete